MKSQRSNISICFRVFSAILLSLTSITLHAQNIDSLAIEEAIRQFETLETVTVTGVKQGLKLYAEPISSAVISQEEVELKRVTAIKDASLMAANLYIPDYGSRMTSSIYVRGLGTRIDNPVIGLNVDNIPYLNKNAFDTDIMDISRVEMIRGPQSTLYGRNTMGGVINIYTLSPLSYQGIRAGAEYSSGNSYRVRASVYDKTSDKFGYSIGASYNSSDGFFTNEHTGELLDWERGANARVKLQYHPSDKLRIENTAALSTTNQGGYPYENIASGKIAYNDISAYQRLNITDGLSIQRSKSWGEITSISSMSYLDDKMTLDQDFTPESYFTLEQAIEEVHIAEDFIIETKERNGYKSLTGLFAMYKSQKMDAPVTFKEYGIENLILSNMNQHIAPYYYRWNESEFPLLSLFHNDIAAGAIYHESKYERGRWRAALSFRADIEYNRLNYDCQASSSATLYDQNDEIYFIKDIDVNRVGKPSLLHFGFSPKASLIYTMGQNSRSTLYASVSRGTKSGGFNTQMFSDILQQDIMNLFGVGSSYNVEDVIAYEPEHNWTYEIGSHIESRERDAIVDLTLFYIDCRNQQLTVFPEGQTTGRMMTNAGTSRSFGAEIASQLRIAEGWQADISYGYTNAKFTRYISGNDNFRGKYIPYSPQNTIYIGTNYTLELDSERSIIFEVNSNAIGRIYWNEANTVSQPLYALLGSSITFQTERYSVSLWGKNLADTKYDVFYFKSIGSEFMQRARGRTFGAALNINFNN